MRLGPALLVLLVLTVPSAAQAGNLELSGSYPLTEDLVLGPGDTLTIHAGAFVSGPARILVSGVLIIDGSPTDRAEVTVPIVLAGNASSSLSNARLWGINSTALTIRGANVTLSGVAFEGNGVGLDASDVPRLVVRDSLFRAHASDAARVTGASDVLMENVSFEDGQLGLSLTLDDSSTVIIRDSNFERNAQHALVLLGAGPADVRFERVTFGPPSAGAAGALPALTLRGPAVPDGTPRRVTLTNDSFLAGDTALRVEGAGFLVESSFDKFVRNRIGVSLWGANVTLRNDSFHELEHDIEGAASSTLRIVDVVFTPSAVAPVATESPAVGLAPWALPVVLALVATGGALALLRRKAPPMPSPAAKPAPLPVLADLPASLRPLERRILEDLLATPGSAQSAVAFRLGLSRQALHYHVKKLEVRGLLTKTAHGRETKCFAAPGVAEALAAGGSSPPAVTQQGSEEKA